MNSSRFPRDTYSKLNQILDKHFKGEYDLHKINDEKVCCCKSSIRWKNLLSSKDKRSEFI